ncbi:hypothetical protein DFH08DRAFT_823947 [Mycena albidolilacea]|uniref:Uncharacterized protein n=1 Tax=Mycena albidolilacea TaxID=1033008 RepID=A0AAD7EAS0_9AGAR|nr:hypothetical protein DFH08DRAFT_823947 [Mycena albidolilacea]
MAPPLPLSDDASDSLEPAPLPKSEAVPAFKSPIPFETFLRVFAYCRLRERAVITRLCTQLFPFSRHVLYHDVMVFSLIFADDATSVEFSESTIVLPALVNLWRLGITSRILLPQDLMRSLPFRLTCFQATCAVGGNWKDFIASQPGLYELYLDGDFCGVVPDLTVLPNLQSLKARPTDIARFVETHALCDAWFFTGAPLGTKTLSAVELTHFDNAQYCLTTLRILALDFLLLSVAAPEFVELLRHLVLNEDLTWSDFTLDSGADCVAGSTFGRVATALDGQFIHLKSVLLVFASHSKSPSMRAFCFYAQDGVVYWNGWGQPEEEKSYSTLSYPTPDLRRLRRNGTRRTCFVLPGEHFVVMFDPIGFTELMILRGRQATNGLFDGDVRARAKSQLVPTRSTAPQDPEADAQWELFVASLFRASDADEDQDDRPTVEANEVEKARLAEDKAARDLAWDAAVAVALDTMREPDRREWFRAQRMQEEQEARNAAALDDGLRDLSCCGVFKTSDLFGIALGLIHASPMNSDALDENYDDMPALEDDLSDTSWCGSSLKSKLGSLFKKYDTFESYATGLYSRRGIERDIIADSRALRQLGDELRDRVRREDAQLDVGGVQINALRPPSNKSGARCPTSVRKWVYVSDNIPALAHVPTLIKIPFDFLGLGRLGRRGLGGGLGRLGRLGAGWRHGRVEDRLQGAGRPIGAGHKFLLLFPPPLMAYHPKRKKNTTITFSSTSGGSTSANSTAAPTIGVLRKKTTICQDGVMRQERSIVELAGGSTAVHPDVPRSATPELIYEEYAAGDHGGDDFDDKEGGRDLHESDNPLRQWAEDHRDT